MLTASDLHEDAQVAALVWSKLLPSSFAGSPACSSQPLVHSGSNRVMNRSLAAIHSADPFRESVNATDIWALLTAYDEDLVNWQDVYEALRSTLA